MKKITLLLLAQFSLTLFAGEPNHSQRRDPGESYQQAEKRYWDRIAADAPQVKREGSAVNSKTKYADLNFEEVPKASDLSELFTDMRDERFLSVKGNPEFIRRLSWLYPQDGCWIRAALMKQLSLNWKSGAPNKLFIFGNLSVKTDNAPGGSVSWWYHVVPLYRDAEGMPFVVDPAIDPKQPLPLKEWILTQVSDTDKAEYALCSSEAYGPSSPCLNPPAGEDKLASAQIETYLDLEWQNLLTLKRDPEKELGELPPWKP